MNLERYKETGKVTRNQRRRSNCPVNYALQTFGDTWSLLIVRDIVYFGKKTYGEFLASPEGISTNILASRLIWLEQNGILMRTINPDDRRQDLYSLTEKGLDLIPVLMEIVTWSARYDAEVSVPLDWINRVNADKENMLQLIRQTVQNGGSIAAGPDSLMSKLKN